jgi:hydrogenase-4 component B
LVASDPGSLVIARETPTSVSPGVLALLLAGLLVVPALVGLMLGGRMKTRLAPTWACGLENLSPRMQCSATGFSKPIRMIFSSVFRARHEIEIAEESSPWFRPEITFRLRTESVFAKFLYDPLDRLILGVSHSLRRIQTGHIQSYLAYIFLTLIILLLFAR